MPRCFLSVLFLVALSGLQQECRADEFDISLITTSYVLTNGRTSACPKKLSISDGTATFIPSTSVTVDDNSCTGAGGTMLAPGKTILRGGLQLPDVLKHPMTRFVAAVETADRICGQWAFNASSVTWFIANVAEYALEEKSTGARLWPNRAHAIFTGLSDACVYTAVNDMPHRVDEEKPPLDVTEPTKGNDPSNDSSQVLTGSQGTEARAPKSCFPADSTVRLADGTRRLISELRIGDAILVRDGRYSEVFAFSHSIANGRFNFVRAVTRKGALDVSEGHMMLVRGGTKPAGELNVGDELASMDTGEWLPVLRIEHVRKRGLYNPHTITGEIVVNDVLVTTWTTAVPAVTATCALAPLRWWFRAAPRWLAIATGAWMLPTIESVQSILPGR